MKIVKATYIAIFITGLLAGVFFSSSVSAQDISGTWHGKLSIPTGSLTIVFHISQTEQRRLCDHHWTVPTREPTVSRHRPLLSMILL